MVKPFRMEHRSVVNTLYKILLREKCPFFLFQWISQTILERLVREFDTVDELLQKHNFSDVKVGAVGLDRLRKIVQIAPGAQFFPTLSTLIPFLELTPNQEYLVKRIHELSQGGCMSDFKWSSGGSFNDKPWDSSLPTDCAVRLLGSARGC